MGRIVYDFREGLDQEKIVYKNTSWNLKHGFYYILYMLATWGWAAGWFALFQYAYINNEPIAFWVYIGCWLLFMVIMCSIIFTNLFRHYAAKERKRVFREEEAHKLHEKEQKEREDREKRKVEDDGEHVEHNEAPGKDYVLSTHNNENAKLNQ
jgi:hypothetical protein